MRILHPCAARRPSGTSCSDIFSAFGKYLATQRANAGAAGEPDGGGYDPRRLGLAAAARSAFRQQNLSSRGDMFIDGTRVFHRCSTRTPGGRLAAGETLGARFSPYTLRHACATRNYERGVDLVAIQQMLGSLACRDHDAVRQPSQRQRRTAHQRISASAR
jgi:hypothetical protein